jgi:branched-chain amino acid transport system substrate-binding protein
MAPVAEEAGRVLLSPTASSSAVPASRQVYRLFPTARREANKMANFATLELSLRRVGILTVDTTEAAAGDAAREAAEAFQEELERNGGKVVSRGTVPAAEKVSEPAAAEAVAKAASDVLAGDPQAVYVAAFTARARAVVEALDRRGYRGVVLTTSALSAPGLLESTASAADGALLTQTMFEPESAEPEVALFVNAYRQRWDRDPDLYAAHGYDAVKVLARALEAKQGRSRQLWQGVRGLDGVRGVTGFLQFNEKGEAGKFPRVYVVDGGRLDPVEGMPEWKRQRLAGR